MHFADLRCSALSLDWQWEQDSGFRFTNVVRSPAPSALEGFR